MLLGVQRNSGLGRCLSSDNCTVQSQDFYLKNAVQRSTTRAMQSLFSALNEEWRECTTVLQRPVIQTPRTEIYWCVAAAMARQGVMGKLKNVFLIPTLLPPTREILLLACHASVPLSSKQPCRCILMAEMIARKTVGASCLHSLDALPQLVGSFFLSRCSYFSPFSFSRLRNPLPPTGAIRTPNHLFLARSQGWIEGR